MTAMLKIKTAHEDDAPAIASVLAESMERRRLKWKRNYYENFDCYL